MAVASAIAGIGLAVSAAGTVASLRAGKKATRAQKKANESQRKINRLKNLQARRAFLRQYRQAQANVLSGAIAAGVGLESSAFQGTLQSERSQARTALGEFKQMDQLGGEMTKFMNQQSSAAGRAQTFGAVSNFASQFIAFKPR